MSNPPTHHFTILYFASAATYTQTSSQHFPAPMSLADLFQHLEKSYPGMGEKVLTSCLFTINLDYVDVDEDTIRSTVIKEGDEVAIIPPVSSG
ncbi:MAG: hypothetical protein L6R38_001066 [Xanthoria sp. 2 TBL-2021]|nr:MAG: hypothetical protein L6R38_001066 [Xanthoria sp. 2 TBL-2021]